MDKKFISKKGGWPWDPKLDGSSQSWSEWWKSLVSTETPGTGNGNGNGNKNETGNKNGTVTGNGNLQNPIIASSGGKKHKKQHDNKKSKKHQTKHQQRRTRKH